MQNYRKGFVSYFRNFDSFKHFFFQHQDSPPFFRKFRKNLSKINDKRYDSHLRTLVGFIIGVLTIVKAFSMILDRFVWNENVFWKNWGLKPSKVTVIPFEMILQWLIWMQSFHENVGISLMLKMKVPYLAFVKPLISNISPSIASNDWTLSDWKDHVEVGKLTWQWYINIETNESFDSLSLFRYQNTSSLRTTVILWTINS